MRTSGGFVRASSVKRQSMKDQIIRLLKRRLKILRAKRGLNSVPSMPCKTEFLNPLTDRNLAEIFNRVEIHQEWAHAEEVLMRLCQIEDEKTGGVNPGDRRALWYLIKGFRPSSVLEIRYPRGSLDAPHSSGVAK